MEHLATRIVVLLAKKDIIPEEDEEIYVYGSQLLLNFIAATCTFLILGAVTGQTLNTVLFIISFVLMRECAGGYHASSQLRCYLLSVSIYILFLLCLLCTAIDVKQFLFLPFLLTGDLILLAIAPTQNQVNPKTMTEMEKNKIKMRHRLIFLNIIAVFFRATEFLADAFFVIAVTLIAIAILSIFNIFPNQKKEES